MPEQSVIQGDALKVMSALVPSGPIDCVIFDPPAVLPPGDTVRALDYAHMLSCDHAALFFFGVNPNVLVREVGDSLWQIQRLFTLVGAGDNLVRGHVLYGRKPGSHRTSFDSQYQTVAVTGEKGSSEHDTTKPTTWFDWIFAMHSFENVLDPFSGLAPVGLICKRLGIGYTGIELDEATAALAHRALAHLP